MTNRKACVSIDATRKEESDFTAILTTGLLVAAAVEDVRRYRISNKLILLGLFLGICVKIRQNGYFGIIIFAFGAIAPVLVLWYLFRFRMVGAGDIKLLSVIGGLYSIYFVTEVFIAALFLGAVMSLFQLLKHRCFRYRLQYLAEFISNYLTTGEIRPYYLRERDGTTPAVHMAVAILGGFLWTIFKRKGGAI